jgi:hypothetical protein
MVLITSVVVLTFIFYSVTLASLPLQCHTPASSSKRSNCLARVLKSVKVLCALLTQRSSGVCDSPCRVIVLAH